MSTHQQLKQLLAGNNWSQADKEWLLAYLEQNDTGELQSLMLQMYNNELQDAVKTDEQVSALMWQHINDRTATSQVQQVSTHRIPLFKRRWFYYAAAIFILAIGSGIYYLNHQSWKSTQSGKSGFKTMAQAIPPGTNKAILTLANGIQKELSLTDNGLQLQSDAVLLTTPNGGQYQAVLPDGSKVWLNAASSIKFPSAFNNKERRVEVTGEVYIEVVKNLTIPFIVKAENTTIQVLGTSFNINSYPDEENQRTTLLSGSVRILSNNKAAVLQPGQQAIISSAPGKKITVQAANIEQTIAWKNGLINLDGVAFEEIMKQIERWYDIEVVYKNNKTPNSRLAGAMTRDVPLNGLLKNLEKLGIHYELNNRTLIILP